MSSRLTRLDNRLKIGTYAFSIMQLSEVDKASSGNIKSPIMSSRRHLVATHNILL
jgi:hypothetical protein